MFKLYSSIPQVIEDWKFIAMVLDRLFLILFLAACLMGTGGIILRAPSLYDYTEPIDKQLSGSLFTFPKKEDKTIVLE